MIDMRFDAVELEDMRVALMSGYHNAADEERTLHEQIRLGHYEDAEHHKVLAHSRSQAALRMLRYSHLAERMINALVEERSKPPTS